MFIIKKNYYFYIDNTNPINLRSIRKSLKIVVIYRNNSYNEPFDQILKLRKECKRLKFSFYVANNFKLAKKIKADGLYISAFNKNFYTNIKLIGSAHNFKEINQKIRQRCKTIILSRLFKTNYKEKKDFYGILKFNLINQKYNLNLIPLGGINNYNLLKLNLIKSGGFATLSGIKKKPIISNRLF